MTAIRKSGQFPKRITLKGAAPAKNRAILKPVREMLGAALAKQARFSAIFL
jgi:hypothetical protein